MKYREQALKRLRDRFWRYMAVGILLVLISLGFGRLSYGVVMPYMRHGLDMSYAQAGFLGTVTSLGYLVTVLLAGWLSTRWGYKQTVLTGCGVLVGSMVGLAFTPTYLLAVMFMLGAGVGSGLVFTPALSLMVGWFPERRGLAAGFLMSGTGLALVLSGLFVPLVGSVSANGWRWVWVCFAGAALAVLLLAGVVLQNPPRLASPGGGGRSLVKEVCQNPRLLRVAVMYFCFGIAYLIPSTFQMSFMLAHRIPGEVAGLITAMGGLLSLAGTPFWGAVSDGLGRRRTLMIVFGTVTVAMFIPVLWPTLPGFFLMQLLSGTTMAAIPALLQAAASEQVPPLYVPVAIGYVTMYFSVGQLLGPGLGGWLIDHFSGFVAAYLFVVSMLGWGWLLSIGVKTPPPVGQPVGQAVTGAEDHSR